MLTESKLKKLVSLMVEKKLLMLTEGNKFQAIRSLTIEAQHAAMKFEDTIVDALDLLDPDQMSEAEQQVYSQAMSQMHTQIVNAVVEAANTVKDLSSPPKQTSVAVKKPTSTASDNSIPSVEVPKAETPKLSGELKINTSST